LVDMRNRFDEQLDLLNQELIQMGALCEEVIDLVTKALVRGKSELAKKVAPLDGEIDQKERTIESMCLKLLLHQQPVARDLRQISSALKMITDMERIGDQAEDIAEIIGFLDKENKQDYKFDETTLQRMGDSAKKMVVESVTAYVNKDLALARSVVQEDDIVDALFLNVKQELIERIALNKAEGEYILDLLMIAKYLERIGDHAVNIAQWVVFSVTGEHEAEE
jgi:phosphate transport system protein